MGCEVRVVKKCRMLIDQRQRARDEIKYPDMNSWSTFLIKSSQSPVDWMIQSCEVMAILTPGGWFHLVIPPTSRGRHRMLLGTQGKLLNPETSWVLSLSITRRTSWSSLTKLTPLSVFGFLNYTWFCIQVTHWKENLAVCLLLLQILDYISFLNVNFGLWLQNIDKSDWSSVIKKLHFTLSPNHYLP